MPHNTFNPSQGLINKSKAAQQIEETMDRIRSVNYTIQYCKLHLNNERVAEDRKQVLRNILKKHEERKRTLMEVCLN